MEKTLTVIVPTYNMERLLQRCLDSLVINDKKVMTLLEVLVIIDGATDRSSDIAHEYETLHPETFRVIDKENGNYGSCINRGLEEAKGRYVKILDADDSFNTESLVKLIDTLNNTEADLVITNYCICSCDSENTERKAFQIPANVTLTAKDLAPLGPHMAMHAVTYKTENLRNIGYHQTEKISYTDQEWIFKPMTTVSTFIYADTDLYQYTVGREGQTMDIKAMARNMYHNVIVMRNMVDTYNATSCSSDIIGYLRGRLECYMEYIYSLYLFHTQQMDVEPLIRLDKELKHLCPPLYRHVGTLKAGKLPFVRLWRLFYYKNDHGINDFFRYRRYRLWRR